MDTDTVLMDDCFEYVDDLRGDGLDDSMMLLRNSVMVEFRTVCQHCQILIIDYVIRDVGRETPEAHFLSLIHI